jgi:hypothetical protein
MPFMRNAVATVAILVATSAVAQDRLRPEAGVLWDRDEYYAKIREAFADTLKHDIVVQIVFVPSFQPEEIAGIRRNGREF